MIDKARRLLIIILILVLETTGACAQATGPRETESPEIKAALGVAIAPRNFPSHSALDVDNAFQTAATIAGHSVFIYQRIDKNNLETGGTVSSWK